jgi:hypothetical protein
MSLSLFFSLAGFCLCVFFCFFAGIYLRRRTGQERILAEFREEVYKFTAVIDAAADRNSLLVEDRIKSLKALLEEVDKRMGLYTRELDRRRVQEKAYAELGKTRSAPSLPREKAPEPPPEPPPEEPEKSPKGDEEKSARKIEPKPPSLAEQATKLARAGFSANIIAARLGVSISEIELVLAITKG